MRQASLLSRPRPPKPKPKLSPNKHALPSPASDDPPLALAGPAGSAAAPAAPAESVPAKTDATDDKQTMSGRRRPPAPLPKPAEPWKHPAELEYIRIHSWSQSLLISYLIDNAFDVPPRHPQGSADPWCVLTSRNGSSTVVPKGYRLPLMFAMKFQWESLRLVLSSPQREDEWEDYKFDILHVSRLCSIFLQQAREAKDSKEMDKMWRCPTFDRALTRYYRRWLVNREEFLMAFWKEFEEAEYEEDVLKKDWTRFVLKGHKGFHLTKEECAEGLSYQTLTVGLEQHSDGHFHWQLPPSPPVTSLDSDKPKEKKSRKVTGKRKRGGDKEKHKQEDKEKEKEKGPWKDNDKEKQEKVGMKSTFQIIHGWKGTQDSPERKLKLSFAENTSPPPAKKARVKETTEEKEKDASGSSLLGERESLESSDVSSRTIVQGKETEGVEKVQQEKKKEEGDKQAVYLEPLRISIERDDGKIEEECKGDEENGEEKEQVEEEDKGEKERMGDEEDKGDEQKGEEKEKGEEEDNGEEKDNGTSEEDDDDRILQMEGLMYPEPQSEAMEVVSLVPHCTVDKDEGRETEEDKQRSADASHAKPPAPALPGAHVLTTVDSAPSHATTVAVPAPIDTASISNTTEIVSSVATPAPTTSTSTTLTITSIMNSKLTSEPSSTMAISPPTVPTATLPVSAPSAAQPSHHNPTPLNTGDPSTPLPSSSSPSAAAPVAEGTSKDATKEVGTSLEKRQSSWDARVSKALERARALKSSGPGMLIGAGVSVPPRAAWYVPQIPQWDGKEKERVIQGDNSTESPGSPVLPAAGRSPALRSRPSTSDSNSGSGSGSRVISGSTNQPRVLSSAPEVESEPALASLPQPPVFAQSDDLATTAVSLSTVTETGPNDRGTRLVSESSSNATTGPTDVDPPPLVEPSSSAPDPVPLVSPADAPSETPALLSPEQTLDPQLLSRSPPQFASPALTPSNDQMRRQTETPRARPQAQPRPSAREFPPLPGPSLPGRSATFEEYQLAAADWSGSGSSDHGNDSDFHQPEAMREHHIGENDRDMQHNRADHRHEREMYYDGYHRYSTTPSSPPYRRYHPYPYRPPSRPRYYPFAPPYYPPTPYGDQPPYIPPSVSTLYRPSRRSSVNGGSLSEVQSPVPDIDPLGAELDGSPVATRIVSIVQDTMMKLADVLSATGSVRDSGIRAERSRQRSSVVSGSVSAGKSQPDHQRERAGGGGSLKMEDLLGEIRSLKEEHRREVNKLRSEIEGLRMQVQTLERRGSRELGTDGTTVIFGADHNATEANGVVVHSSLYPMDLTSDARDRSLQVDRPISLVKGGVSHRLDINVPNENSPSLALSHEGVCVSEVDKDEAVKVGCPPRLGPTSSNDGIPMSPSHNGLPLPIKSQRKGRMFVPIDMTDNSQ